MKRRSGFSLIELLVAIGIVTLLIAVLVPAVQNAREASRRSECINHLRQIGVALNNYQTNHRIFPPGSTSKADICQGGRETMWNLMFEFLDDVNRAEQHRKYMKTAPNGNSINAPMIAIELPIMICPSATHTEDLLLGSHAGNYAATYGTDGTYCHTDMFRTATNPRGWWNSCNGPAPPALPPNASTKKGPFNINSSTRERDVQDGLSKTIFVSEVLSYEEDQRGRWGIDHGVYYSHAIPPNHIEPDQLEYRCGSTSKNCVLLPPGPPPDEPRCLSINGARSMHAGTVHVLFGDGTAQSVSDSIEINVWKALATINNSDIADGF